MLMIIEYDEGNSNTAKLVTHSVFWGLVKNDDFFLHILNIPAHMLLFYHWSDSILYTVNISVFHSLSK